LDLHKHLLLISSILFFSTRGFGQAAVDISLVASTLGYNFQLQVGLDLTATTCIDSHLGESSLPSPPPGVTEIRFDLYDYGCGPMSTYSDYRAPGNPPVFPFSGMIEHKLVYMLSTPASPIDITYDIPLGAFITISDEFGGVVLNLGPFTGQGTTTIPGSYTNIFSYAFVLMEYNNILPVELASFTSLVLQNEKTVQLNWTTATETNNSGFEIHCKEQNATDWETIGFVPGFGTTTEPKSYSFTDEGIETGTYKYRLKQIDYDGTYEYSIEIEIEFDFTPREFILSQNYPNPFNPSTIIRYEIPERGFVTLKVYDVLGNEIATLVNEEKSIGSYAVEFNATGLPNGIYFYQLQAGSFVETKKMILLR